MGSRRKFGDIPQRQLVVLMRDLVDAAAAKNSTAHRDIARTKLRHILETENWRTSYVLNNISSSRCKFLASIGYWVPTRWLLTDWKRRPGRDKPSAED